MHGHLNFQTDVLFLISIW